jgi:uncharacterized integral membrane protein
VEPFFPVSDGYPVGRANILLIHIYVTPIKRFLQALWAVGVLGSLGTYLVAARPLDEGLVQYVLEHPAALWFVGPTFAALTGLVFKEGRAASSSAYISAHPLHFFCHLFPTRLQ